jgi:RHS repeat-associated protein
VSRQGRSSSHRAFLFQPLFLFPFDGDRSPARSRLLFVLAVYGRDMFLCSGMKAGGPPVRLRSIIPGYAGETAHHRICHLMEPYLPLRKRLLNVACISTVDTVCSKSLGRRLFLIGSSPGRDLSGGLAGAGGIGGLMAVKHHAGDFAGRTFWPVCDDQGNVVALVDADAPSHPVVASMEYGPFGELLAVDGAPYSGIDRSTLAELCPLLFSTKYLDAELAPSGGLYYYGYRYYEPTAGKWLSRDPIAEQGGLNLYAFKDPVNTVDPVGKEVTRTQQRNFLHDSLRIIENSEVGQTNIGKRIVGRLKDLEKQGKIEFKNLGEPKPLDSTTLGYWCPRREILVLNEYLTRPGDVSFIRAEGSKIVETGQEDASWRWRIPMTLLHEGCHALQHAETWRHNQRLSAEGAGRGMYPREMEYEAWMLENVLGAELYSETHLAEIAGARAREEQQGVDLRRRRWGGKFEHAKRLRSWPDLKRSVDFAYEFSTRIAGQEYKWLDGFEDIRKLSSEMYATETQRGLRHMALLWWYEQQKALSKRYIENYPPMLNPVPRKYIMDAGWDEGSFSDAVKPYMQIDGRR